MGIELLGPFGPNRRQDLVQLFDISGGQVNEGHARLGDLLLDFKVLAVGSFASFPSQIFADLGDRELAVPRLPGFISP